MGFVYNFAPAHYVLYVCVVQLNVPFLVVVEGGEVWSNGILSFVAYWHKKAPIFFSLFFEFIIPLTPNNKNANTSAVQ